jgi:hypothetical protein
MESFIEPLVRLSDTKSILQGSVQVSGYRSLAYSTTLWTPHEWTAIGRKCYLSYSAPVHSMLLFSAPYTATSPAVRHHTGIVFFIARNPTVGIGIVVAAVVYSDLLYNQHTLVENMPMEILVSMTKS